jgi:gliding motility-associated-like protein
MDKLKILFSTLIYLSLSFSTSAQNGLDAEIISGNIDVCDSESVAVNLDIQFSGETPFKFKIRLFPGAITFSADYIYSDDLDVNGIYHYSTNISLSIPEGQNNASFLVQVTEMSGDGTTYNPTTDPGITFTNWKLPSPNAGSDIDSCGLSAVLSAAPDPVSSVYFWETPANGALSEATDINSSYSASSTGTYPLTFTQENGVCTAQDEVQVTFRGSPSASLSTTSQVCGTTSQEATLNLSFSGNDSPWIFAVADQENQQITGSATTSEYNETVNVQGETTYSLLWVKDSNGCLSNPEDLTGEATIVDLKPATNAGNDTAVCGLQIDLNGKMSALAQYGEWQITSGNILNNDITNPKATYQQSTWGETTLTWIETNGLCTATDDVLIRFDEPPVAFAGEDFTLYNQYETILRAGQPVSTTNNWVGEWYISSGPGAIANPGDQNATLTGLKHGQVNLEWAVTNGVCPEVSDNLTITVKGLTYYTGISPLPDDDLNDSFSIKGAHTIPQNELIIFDQRGKVVFKKSNLEEENQWDGVDTDGHPLENGIYYFIFKGDGIQPVKDYIVIKRKYN